MYQFLVKNGQTVGFGLGLIVTVVFLISVLSGLDTYSTLPEEEQVNTTIFNAGLYGALALTVIAAVAMIFFGLYHIASNFKGSAKGIIGFAVLVAVFLISYSTSSGEAEGLIKEAVDKAGSDITPNNLKFISGGITTALVLIGAAALAFVLSEIRNFFK